jgi:hypothetical protein
LSVCSGDLDAPFPGPIQLSTALAYFADVLSSPHKDALLALASCATDANEAEQLKLLASAAGKARYTEYIAKQHRSLMEVRGGAAAGVMLKGVGRCVVCSTSYMQWCGLFTKRGMLLARMVVSYHSKGAGVEQR